MTDAELDKLVARLRVMQVVFKADATIPAKAADAITALREERDIAKKLVRDICAEWQEPCEPCCDSYGHDENCRATNIAAAKKALQQERDAARVENERLRALLKESAEYLNDFFDWESRLRERIDAALGAGHGEAGE